MAGTLVAAAISAFVTVYVTDKQANASSSLASTQYFREQQKSAYAGFLSSEQKVRNASIELYDYIYYHKPPSPDEMKRLSDVGSEAMATLADSADLITLVGTPAANDAASVVFSDYRGMWIFLLVTRERLEQGEVFSQEDLDTFRGNAGNELKNALLHRAPFVAAARTDIGSPLAQFTD